MEYCSCGTAKAFNTMTAKKKLQTKQNKTKRQSLVLSETQVILCQAKLPLISVGVLP